MAHMEATILDTNFNIVGIVDDYQSMIWTERYAEAGDFELYGAIGSTISKYCRLGYFVTIPESNRAMIIESIEFSQELNESDKILVSGRSLEALLLRRIVWDQTILSGETYGKVQNAVKKLLTDNAIEPEDANRAIPNLIFLDSTEEDITSLEFDSAQFTGNTLYDAVKQFADAFDIGFKIELFGTYLVFSLFAGKNRSFEQSTNNYVVYSSEYDNLLSSDFKQNITNFSNVALVAGEGEGSERRKIKYYYDFSEPSGMNRYELFVDARDISSTVDDGQGGSTQLTDQEYEYELANRGASKLAEVAEDYSFDAQIDTINSYQYGTDYFIGDILQLIDDMGNSGQFRITEFIRSMDSSGYSAYPQFKIISRMDSVIPVDLQGLPARVASLPDCADDMPLKDLVVGIEPKQAGSGDPYPAGGGKNKYDPTYLARPSNIYIAFFGNYTAASASRGVALKANTEYTITIRRGTGATGARIGVYGCWLDEKVQTTFFSNSTANPAVFRVTQETDRVLNFWGYFSNSDAPQLSGITCQIEQGSQSTDYAPYSNIRPISGWDSVKVSATGKNLCPPLSVETSELIGASYRGRRSVIPQQRCVMSFVDKDDTVDVSGISFGFFDSSYTTGALSSSQYRWVLQNGVVQSEKINIPTNLDNSINLDGIFAYPKTEETWQKLMARFYIQIEFGTTVTDYVPYNGQTATIPLPHTVYGGELDAVSGSGSETHSIIDLGDLSWTYTSGDHSRMTATLTGSKGAPSGQTFSGACSIYKSAPYNAIYNHTQDKIIGISDTGTVWVYDSDYTDADVFTTAVTGQKLCYEPATPTTYSATPTEITTQYGLNNIFADTGNINKVIYFKNKWR